MKQVRAIKFHSENKNNIAKIYKTFIFIGKNKYN